MIIGLDEAGRGALAGPVVAGAVSFNDQLSMNCDQFKDSKKLTEAQREALSKSIKQKYAWGIGVVEASVVDEIGIKKATNRAMRLAVEQLMSNLDPRIKSEDDNVSGIELWVDGNDQFVFPYVSKDFIKGDELHPVISAASIIAKVYRDERMIKHAQDYPRFQFERNKGYGSSTHIALLEKEVYCEIHRKTYDPLKTIRTQTRLEI